MPVAENYSPVPGKITFLGADINYTILCILIKEIY